MPAGSFSTALEVTALEVNVDSDDDYSDATTNAENPYHGTI